MSKHSRSPKLTFSIIALVLGLGGFLVLSVVQSVLPPYITWLLVWSVVTLGLFGYDKTQAKIGGGRVPEIVLFGAILIGGFLGGWLGMLLFNHKRRKLPFWIVLIIATVIHGFIFFYLFVMG